MINHSSMSLRKRKAKHFNCLTETQAEARVRALVFSLMNRSRPAGISISEKSSLYRLARKFPNVITKVYGGDHVLHAVCKVGASVEAVKAVYRAYPEAIAVPNKLGYLPIHLACMGHSSLDVVQLLTEQYLQSLGIYHNDRLPLDYACSHRYGLIKIDIIGFLLESYPEAATKSTPLHVLINAADPCNYTTIPANAVRLILETAPGAASKKNRLGKLPIDHCLSRKANGWHLPAGTLELLLRYTPIHHTWSSQHSDWPTRLQALAYHGHLEYSERGDPICPLHSILQCGDLNDDQYLESVEQFLPNATTNKEGQLPLHVALMASASHITWRVVRRMIGIDARSLSVQDPVSGLYPALSMASKRWSLLFATETLSLIYEAISSNPMAVLSNV